MKVTAPGKSVTTTFVTPMAVTPMVVTIVVTRVSPWSLTTVCIR